MNRPTADCRVENGTVLTLDSANTKIRDGAVIITGDRIAATGTREALSAWEVKERVDARGGIILPGLVNLHSHLPMTLFRGLADDLPLMTWLHDHIFPAEAAHLNPETVRVGALLGCAEMLLSGTTACCDGYFIEEEVAQAVFETGMRGVLAQGVIDYPAPGVPDPTRNLEAAREYLEQWSGRVGRIQPSIFCHSPYTCSETTLIKAKQLADRHGVLFQVHVSETRDEVERSLSEHGITPVAYLHRLGLLDRRTLLIHAVWTDADDIALIAASGAAVAHCPESNMKLASGIAPVPAFLSSGIRVGIGTDGSASNNDLDLFGEMDTAAKLHKVNSSDPTVLNAETVLRMATIEGARAMGMDQMIGSLEPGKQADLVMVDTHTPRLTPMYNPVSHLVYAVQGADVRDVMVAGRWVVRDRELLTIDIEAVMAKVNEIAAQIYSPSNSVRQ